MKNQLKILKYFIEHKESSISINQLARILDLNYRIAFEDANKLKNEGLLQISKVGNTNQCRFNYKYDGKIWMVEDSRRNTLLKNKNIKVIFDRVNDVENPFFTLLLFGSYANNKSKKYSDIDLCLITDVTQLNAKIKQIVRLLPLNIQLLDFTVDEFRSMLDTKKQNVGKEIVNNNVVLHNIEGFYGIISG